MTDIKQPDLDLILDQIKSALSDNKINDALVLLDSLRIQDRAGLFSDLQQPEQDMLIPLLEPYDTADLLEELEDEEAAEIAQRLNNEELVQILGYMEPDEAADLLGDISKDQATELLAALSETEEILPLLAHHDESAGGLMTAVDVIITENMTVEESIHHLRTIAPDSETIYYLFVTDQNNILTGVVSLRQLIISSPETKIKEVMDPDHISVLVNADQEEAARLMSRYDLLALPVVDEDRKLLGIITYDDLVEVLEDEATEDIYRLGGVPEGQPINVSIPTAIRNRLPWLILNVGTAMASAAVLSLFENTIAQVAVLAAFFPIVAGVSGSAGTQALTITVRGLALGQISRRDGYKTLLRELSIGLMNGTTLGIIVALIALSWKGTPLLGIVVGVATFINLLCAAFAGVIVPLGIQLIDIDPALASPILVTTVTDTFGYLIYLGMATILIEGFL